MYRSPRDSMEEVIDDFEKMIRMDSRMDTLIDHGHADNDEIERFYFDLTKLAEKHTPDFNADEACFGTTYENALIVCAMLHRRFKEIMMGDLHP